MPQEHERVGRVPRRRTEHLPNDIALGIEECRRRQPCHAERELRAAGGIDVPPQVLQPVLLIERIHDRKASAILAQCQHEEVVLAQLRLKAIERRHLPPARPAPRRPQVQQHPAAAHVPKAQRLPVAADELDIRRRFEARRQQKVLDLARRQRVSALDQAAGVRDPRTTVGARPQYDGRGDRGRDPQGDRGTDPAPRGPTRRISRTRHQARIGSGDMSTKPDKGRTKPHELWGGRFRAGPSALMQQVNASIAFDKALASQDLAVSRAHCTMLVATGIVGAEDGHAILKGLDAIEAEIADGRFVFDPALEDIHMHIEARLRDLVGPAAGRLHTGRSRNDQVATDLRLWVRDVIGALDAALRDLQHALVDQAERNAATILPGLTHLQPAQPVTFGHHLLAHFEAVDRDRGRFRDCAARLNESPLGAAALAGTSFPIDRDATARTLGFDRPMANSMDAVSARDFAAEFLAAAAIAATHLSRLGEEIVLWASAPFGFVRLPDTFTTGSSIMPQKRNPDGAELVRAKTGRIAGGFVGLLMVLKGLPLAYAKDLQEDKEPVFAAAEELRLCIAVMTGMVAGLDVTPERMRAAADEGFLTATDFADWLVQSLDVPFRTAHAIAGRAVRRAEERGCGLAGLSLDELQALEPRITGDVYAALRVEGSVARRTSTGGTAPDRVAAAVARARERLA